MNSQPTIALSESIDAAGTALLQEHSRLFEYESLHELIESRKGHHTDAIIVRSIPVDGAAMDEILGLKVIGRHGAGLDNIDLDAAKQRGIKVVNTPHSNTHSVAEYVIGASYTLLKRFSEVSSALRSGVFTASDGSLPGQVQRHGFSGRELTSCFIGIVGYGAIGRQVARIADANGMRVGFYDPFLPSDASNDASHRRFATLEQLLAESDVVTLHVPGTQGGAPLIAETELSLMKPGSFLINAARGSLVSLEAVAEALQNGTLAGAAVDVFTTEPPTLSPELLEHPNVLFTPHMAAMTHEALERMAVDVATATLRSLREV